MQEDGMGRLAEAAESIRVLESFCRRAGFEREADRLHDVAERVALRRFRLAVMGQFKRGKSTFLNALIGTRLLPTGILPVTSVATTIAYGPMPRLDVEHADGHVVSTDVGELPLYVTEAGNPGNRRAIRRVTVFVPNPWLRDGLELVDVPGLASSIRANTEAAEEALQNVDAVILVLGVDPPVTEAELGHVAEIDATVPRVFFVQNKRDRFTAEEWGQGIEFNRQALAEVLGRQVDLLSVSALDALSASERGDPALWDASGIPHVREVLNAFLNVERRETWVRSLRQQVVRAIRPVENGFSVQRAALEAPIADLEARLQRLAARRADLAERREGLRAALRESIRGWSRELWRKLEGWMEATRPELEASLESRLLGGELPRVDVLEAAVDDAVLEALDHVIPDVVDSANALLRQWGNRLAASFAQLTEEEEQAFAEFAGVPWRSREEAMPTLPSIPPIVLSADRQSFFPPVTWAMLSPLLPLSLRRRALRERIQARLSESLDRSIGQIRQHVASACDESARRLWAYWADESGQIGAALDALLQETVRLRGGLDQTTDAALRNLDREEEHLVAAVDRFERAMAGLTAAPPAHGDEA